MTLDRTTGAGLPELASALRANRTSAGQLFAQCAAARDENHAAYRTWAPEYATRHAAAADAAFAAGIDTGPLQGIPVSVKDLYGVCGLPVFAGSPRELPQEWQREGPVIRCLRQQLGVIVGKTHTVEFAFGGLGTNTHWGAPRNPRDPSRLAGGSSSGAGASIAEGSALLALGSDTAGSIRTPASMTGTAGLKPTQGRWPTEGIVPLSPSLDTPGLIARSVRDLAWAFPAFDPDTATPPEAAEPRQIALGVAREFFCETCDPGIVETMDAAIDVLGKAGVQLRVLELPGCREAVDIFRAGGLAAPELDRFLADELPQWRETLDPAVRARLDLAAEMTAREYLQRRKQIAALSRNAATVLADVDAVITPTVPITPPRPEDVATPEDYRRANLLSLRNTTIANLMGLCALTLPAGVDASGMPVGLQLMAAPWREERLLAVGQCLETCLAAE